ncbi:protein TIFY 6a-like isoform X1 [Zingiber officinale]|uniref:protein TIFY 6a-like isoform X1 n=1 Tax=Zingiber officinale TaxID=94328 RepID=UPI001C4D4CF4|nr:protein TIFY 6a-like isoform X1 [Zingiber officinale]
MERDFLSITGGGAEEEAKGSRHDSGWSRQWPSTKNASSLQQFIPLKVAQEDRTNSFSFDLVSSPMFQPMKVANSPASTQQKSFSLHDLPLQITAGLSASSCRASGTRSFPMTSSNSDVNSDPFFKFHNEQHQFGGATLNNPFVNMNIGTLAPSNVPVVTKMMAQLTIFYAGTVHVYDDVSFDKAEAIIALVSEGSNSKGTLNASRSKAPFKVTAPVPTNFPASDSLSTKQILCPTPLRVVSPCSGFSNPMLVTPVAGANSRSSFSTPSDIVGANIMSSLSPSIKQEPSRTLPSAFGSTVSVATSSRAVPQARKASLARFLEKRKERANNAMPYSTSKKNHDTNGDLESANASNISWSPDVNLSSNWSRIPNCP